MAHDYRGSIDLAAGIRPRNNGAWAMVDAHDVQVGDDPFAAGDRLDATLSGLSGSLAGYLALNYTDATEIPANGDLNSYTAPGNYYVTTANAASISHAPTTTAGYRLTVIRPNSSSYCVQIAVLMATEMHVYMRPYSSSGWQAWKTLATEDQTELYFPTSSLTTFTIADMPRRSYTMTTASKLTGAPSGITSTDSIWVERSALNSAGNISVVTLVDRTSFAVYMAIFTEPGTLGDWQRIMTAADVADALGEYLALSYSAAEDISANANLNDYTSDGNYKAATAERAATITNGPVTDAGYRLTVTHPTNSSYVEQIAVTMEAAPRILIRAYTSTGWKSWQTLATNDYVEGSTPQYYSAPASPATFGLSDMPRYARTYCNEARFTDTPSDVAGTGHTIYLERRKANKAGNISYLMLYDITAQTVYVSSYTEGQSVKPWVRLAKHDEILPITSAVGNSYNLFNKDTVSMLNAYFAATGTNAGKITSSSSTRTLYVPVEPDTDYVFSREPGIYTTVIGTSPTVPAVGDTLTVPTVKSAFETTRNYYTFHTSTDAAYLCVYFYHSGHDTQTVEQMLDTMVLTEGMDYKAYRAYQEIKIENTDQMPVNTYGIFGIRFRRNNSSPLVKRIYDAEGLTYRQQVGEDIQYSDFDKAFPWCEMRECNVTVDGNGKKTIVYKGESGFSRSNDTFIEVPAFYFKRTVVNGVEEWCISGRPFSGADLEPWFLDDNGDPVKYRYIAKYEGADGTNGISVTGETPYLGQTRKNYRDLCAESNLTLMDCYGYFALSHLMAIECGTLDLQTINVGVSYMAYEYSGANWNHPTNTGSSNTATLTHLSTDLRLTYLDVGDTIYISDTTNYYSVDDPRTITAISFPNDTTVQITFDGEPYTFGEDSLVYPAVQPTGRTDDMTYVNGRIKAANMVTPFQYRGIENPYGNAWETGDGIKWILSTGKFNIHGVETSFTAPVQTASGSDSGTGGWIKTLGYDRDMPWATLPETVGGTKGNYISDEWNSGPDDSSITEPVIAFSGGWDHQSLNGAFIARGISVSNTTWLYGYRAMC